MKNVRVTLLSASWLLCVALGTICLAYENPPGQDKSDSSQPAPGATHAYLGIGVESLHPSLWSHLEELLGEGRGVLLVEVAPGSPADKAGLKPHDILANYDDQKIYSPEQLVKLVRHDKSGREVTLGIIRAGKKQEVKLMLGSRSETSIPRRHLAFWPLTERAQSTAGEREAQWTSFDSLTLTRLDDKRFKAEIKYRDDKGKIDTQTFEGTRDELRKAIQARQDLPTNERNHLLNALDLPNHPMEFDFPGVRFTPSGVFWDFDQTEQ